MKVGIEAATFFIPDLFLEISELAEHRGIDNNKLLLGLGLQKMAIIDTNEDTATLAAEALLRLFTDYEIHPKEIARIYLGTESALDAAKPTATFAVQMVETQLATQFGERCFKNCDVLDMTFACIGGIDALHNALDFVRINPNKKAIVLAADYAKYELNSGGEYTQGAGAIALLISATPNLIEIENYFGVGMSSVYDFFKPRRHVDKDKLINAPENYPEQIEIFSDEPIFDGQYSNECYKQRNQEAFYNFKSEKLIHTNVISSWEYIIFHLPYAFHGKRIFAEIFASENNIPCSTKDEVKAVLLSDDYKQFINNKIEPSQRASSEVGNLYTASIFMALFSTLQTAFLENKELTGKKIGFFAYGSGSKAKVFEATLHTNWKSVVKNWNLFEALNQRTAINFETYIQLHKKALKKPVNTIQKGFKLEKIETDIQELNGARYYKYHV